MRVIFLRMAALSAACAVCAAEPAVAPPEPPPPGRIADLPLGLAYAATGVNATVFRTSAVVSDAKFQYATYYDGEGKVVVARRALAGGPWELRTLDFAGNVRDAHNGVVLGLSSDGALHLSYDHHNHPLNYRRSPGGERWAQFGERLPMTGERERSVSYPTFLNAPDGTLYFFYRDGGSGNGRLVVNRYDTAAQKWTTVQAPLLEGEGRRSPYWWRPEFSRDGVLHLAWCWRDTPDAATNHDLCYVRSADGGKTWQNSAGATIPTPIAFAADVIVEKIPAGQNLINQCTLATDAQNRPHIAYYRSDAAGVPQYFHLWNDAGKWRAAQVSARTQAFRLGGGGSLKLPIARPEIAVAKDGTAHLITKDDEFGGKLRLYSAAPPYENWAARDVLPEALGEWEPSYDLARWRRDGVLALFVLPVRQGDHEGVTDFPPQTARVVEVADLK